MQFRLLGLFEVSENGQAVELPRGKERALLAVLLLHANEPVSTDRLVEELWGERPPANAAKTVQVYVSRLRKSIGAARLQTTPAGYVLQVDAGELDSEQFERLAREGREHAAEPARAERLLSEALSLWRGPPLADFRFESFAQAEVRRLEELRGDVVADRVDARLAQGRADGVIAELEELIEQNPLRERPRAQLMLALYQAGRQADALELYRQTRALLAEDLGLEPSQELQALERAILNQDAALAAPESAAHRVLRRRSGRLLLAGGLLIVAAAAAASFLLLQGGRSGSVTVAPGSVAVIDAKSRRVSTAVALAGTPTRLAADHHNTWVAGDQSGTLSVIDARTGMVSRQIATGGFPSAVAVAAGAVWVVDGKSGLLAKIDPAYGSVSRRVRVTARNLAYDQSREAFDPVSLAVGLGSVWLTDGSRRLVRVEPKSVEVIDRIDLRAPLDAVTVGGGAVWAISGTSAAAIRLDRHGRVTARLPIVSKPGFESPYPFAVAADGTFVWVLNGNTATLTKIDAAQRTVAATIPIGIDRGPARLAAGDGAAWVADSDGTLARVDALTNSVELIGVSHRLNDVTVADGNVWVTTGSGLSAGRAPSTTPATAHVQALPTSSCSPISYEGGGRPQYLIASDGPLQGFGRTNTAQVAQAIQFVLKQHHFHAGRYAVGYQACDDATIQLGYVSDARCAANARSFAADKSVIGIIGALNSPCSQVELPIVNRAPDGPLAMISPANTYVGLTHAGPGTAPDEPRRYYPTRIRNYARITAADDFQGAADAILAKQLGVRKAYVLNDGLSYGNGIAADFRAAATKLGIGIAGQETYPATKTPSFTGLVRRVRAAKADGIFLGLFGAYPDTGRLIKDLRAALGNRLRIIAPDSFALDFPRLIDVAGSAAEGMTASAPGIPNARLPAAGKAFVAAFGKAVGQPAADISVEEAVNGAQAAEVLLDAIARSDGTRPSVVKQLFKTRISNGILGSFGFDRNGDITAGAVTIYRIVHGSAVIFRVITPPPALVG